MAHLIGHFIVLEQRGEFIAHLAERIAMLGLRIGTDLAFRDHADHDHAFDGRLQLHEFFKARCLGWKLPDAPLIAVEHIEQELNVPAFVPGDARGLIVKLPGALMIFIDIPRKDFGCFQLAEDEVVRDALHVALEITGIKRHRRDRR